MPLPLKLDSPQLVLFGEGASRGGLSTPPLPPPVDSDFFAVANQLTGHGTPAIAKRVLRSVWELYGRIEGVGLEEYYRDIETRAVIGNIAKAVGKPKEWSTRKADLEELIRRVYVQTTTKETETGRVALVSTSHRTILDALQTGATILTFNYDLVVEEAFSSASMWNPGDGYGSTLPGITKDWSRLWLDERNSTKPPRSKVTLLKLHGSLGWTLYANRTLKLKDRPYYVRKGKVENISVLPPGWNKRVDRNPYKQFWRLARLRLQACESLVIIGYSLPDTDLLAKALFAEVVRVRAGKPKYLSQLVLVDPVVAVRAKLVRLFTPALGPLCEVREYRSLQEFTAPTLRA